MDEGILDILDRSRSDWVIERTFSELLVFEKKGDKMASIRNNGSDQKDEENGDLKECPICITKMASTFFPKLMGCEHQSCKLCLKEYVTQSIVENHVEVSCPECPAFILPSDIALIVDNDKVLINKYEQYSLRRVLLSDSDARWCPAPDCGYAVIASNCKDCPKLKCERAECGMSFCYNCKLEWKENHTCDEAGEDEEFQSLKDMATQMILHQARKTTVKPGDLKECPECRTKILKEDGSCNLLVCAMCKTKFCWLCLKTITNTHFVTPSGCTWFGKKKPTDRIDPLSRDIDELEEMYGTGFTMLEDIRMQSEWDRKNKSPKNFLDDIRQDELASVLESLKKVSLIKPDDLNIFQ